MDPPPPNPYPPPIPTTISASLVPQINHNNAAVTHVAAANPAPAPTFNHPPYADMIYGAIAALREKDGSSRRAIAKYIEQAYPTNQLPPTHDALLTHHLKRLKNSGHLEMVKKSYKLPGTPRSDGSLPPPPSDSDVNSSLPSPGPSRGRGRPPKPKPEQQQQPKPNPEQPIITQQPIVIPQQPIISQQMLPNISQQQTQQQPIPILQQPIPIPQQPIPIPQHPIVQPSFSSFPQPVLTFPEPIVLQQQQPNSQPNSQPMPVATVGLLDEPKRPGRGRPRKAMPVGTAQAQGSVSVSPVVVKRGRGRPPGSRMSKKRPGRPPKPKSVSSSVLGPNGTVKRRPGRPSKAEPRAVFIPYATNVPLIGAFEQQSNGSSDVGPHPAPRGRGRPKKDASASGGAASSGSGKPRGRPPLPLGVERPKVSRSGRPVGRPRKDAMLAITAAPDPSSVADGEFKRKLEYYQTRVGLAVDALKPYLSNESAAGATAAIQELEGFATMDISAPLNIEVQQPVLQS